MWMYLFGFWPVQSPEYYILVYLDLMQPGRKVRRHLFSGFNELDLWATTCLNFINSFVYVSYLNFYGNILAHTSEISFDMPKVDETLGLLGDSNADLLPPP